MLGKLGRFWKIVREVNLDAIREQAEMSFPLLVTADRDEDRARLAALMNGAAGSVNPWLHVSAPPSVEEKIAREPIRLALLVARDGDLSASLQSARAALVARRVPVVTLLVGEARFLDSFARSGEKKRGALASLEPTEETRRALVGVLSDVVAADARLALARQFSGLRQPVFEQLIQETSRANASYAFSTGIAETVPLFDLPLNVGDVIILTKNQMIMAYRIALAAGKHGRPKDVIGELFGVIGGGLLFRQIARELVGLVPVIGFVPKVIVAYGGTWAIGHAVVAWATSGQKATARSLGHLYATGLERGREVARQLSARASRTAA